MPAPPVVAALAFLAAGLGTLGGLGGAVLLVPVLVLLGVDPVEAAPLGLMVAGAGSLAAARPQLESGLVHHRLGITLETTASTGVLVGALLSQALSATTLSRVLAVVALASAVTAGRRKGMRNRPHPSFDGEVAGEWPGTLAGAYQADGGVVPYSARRVPAALGAMVGAGVVSGLAGVGGGFIKTPIMSELMHVPVKVAAATSTFTTGFTAATGLVIFAAQGRIDAHAGAAVVVGGLLGGLVGAAVQHRLSPPKVRVAISVLLAAVAVVLLVRA
ncbi:MAG: sulfite exporter TauE/SafE family protein [Acidimicrobiales bacterium]|nr:sulfite exporter TauE/SafE family protein [Acidimicrobiales bacterium]